MEINSFAAGAVVTLQIAFGSWIVSVVIGLLFALLRELHNRVIDRIISILVNVIRGIPELVLLYIVYFGIAYVGIRLNSLPAAIVALGVSEAAFTTEYFRAAIMSVNPRQRAAAESLGLSASASFVWVVLPQAVPFAIPPLVNCFVSLLKTATLASAVGATELLYQATQAYDRTGDILGISLVVIGAYVVFTIPLTLLASRLEARARRRLGA
jgi:His/Glu/Gln/Arg/opine family amino acid ABC transporter permease subunit